MAITQLQGPRNWGMDIVNVMLSMQGIKERRKYRELQERQLGLSKRHLNIAEATESRAAKVFALGRPARKGAVLEARGRKRLVQRYGRADKELAAAKRELAVARTLGDKERTAAAKVRYDTVKTMHGDSAAMFETILFADEIAKDSRAQLYQAQQQALTANQTTEMIKMQLQDTIRRGQDRLDAVANMVKQTGGTGGKIVVDNIDRIKDTSQSIDDISAELQSQIGAARGEATQVARQGKWIDPAEITPGEREKFDPWSLAEYSDSYRNTGRGVETYTVPRPKDQRRFFWKDSNELTLSKRGAERIGVLDLWDAEKSKSVIKPETKKPIKPFKGGSAGMTYPYTPKKTVKELAGEKARKVTPTKGKVSKQRTYREPTFNINESTGQPRRVFDSAGKESGLVLESGETFKVGDTMVRGGFGYVYLGNHQWQKTQK